MKKISIIFAAALAVLAVSCQKNEELPEGGPATFSVIAPGETSFPKLAKNGSQVIYFAAGTEDVGVKGPLTATFKIGDESLVDKYNAGVSEDKKAKMLPHEAYSFLNATAVIDRYNRTSHAGKINVTNGATLEGETWYVLPVQLASVEGSPKASCDSTEVVFFSFYALALDKGKGTKDAPYLIYDPEDMVKISTQCKNVGDEAIATKDAADAAEPTYFKLMADLDMSGIDWVPYNYNGKYDKKINFDGNHKTISNISGTQSNVYGSIFGVLYGEVYNLNVVNAHFVTNKCGGIIAAYGGTGNNISACIHNCSVTNSKLEAGDGGIGGICGRICAGGSIYECYADVEVVATANKNFIGGILGYDNSPSASVRNCIAKGSVTGYLDGNGSGSQRLGGVVGMLYKTGTVVENCIALNTVKGCRCVGGIVGHANLDKWDEQHPDQTVKGCIAWNPELTAMQINEDGASNGGIIGFASEYNTYLDNWRSPAMKLTYPNGGFAEGENNPGGMYNTLFDQDNCSESSPLEKIIHNNGSKLYRCPYNGKAASASETASAVAKKLGWDENIWDLSNDIPTLKTVY